MADGSWFCLRPSGTEPKAKFYFGVKGDSMEDSQEKLSILQDAVMSKVNEILDKGEINMILVVGGAGYIGSHLVKELVEKEEVVVLDNLSTGHREAIDSRAVFVEGDLGNEEDLQIIFSSYPIKAVMHFAANSLVGESVIDPMKYYENNVASTLTLLKVMMKNDVKKFIFSSTAATYGLPNVEIIEETSPTLPINPYGRSKLMIEHILADFAKAYGLQYVVPRYFNAAGAHESA